MSKIEPLQHLERYGKSVVRTEDILATALLQPDSRFAGVKSIPQLKREFPKFNDVPQQTFDDVLDRSRAPDMTSVDWIGVNFARLLEPRNLVHPYISNRVLRGAIAAAPESCQSDIEQHIVASLAAQQPDGTRLDNPIERKEEVQFGWSNGVLLAATPIIDQPELWQELLDIDLIQIPTEYKGLKYAAAMRELLQENLHGDEFIMLGGLVLKQCFNEVFGASVPQKLFDSAIRQHKKIVGLDFVPRDDDDRFAASEAVLDEPKIKQIYQTKMPKYYYRLRDRKVIADYQKDIRNRSQEYGDKDEAEILHDELMAILELCVEHRDLSLALVALSPFLGGMPSVADAWDGRPTDLYSRVSDELRVEHAEGMRKLLQELASSGFGNYEAEFEIQRLLSEQRTEVWSVENPPSDAQEQGSLPQQSSTIVRNTAVSRSSGFRVHLYEQFGEQIEEKVNVGDQDNLAEYLVRLSAARHQAGSSQSETDEVIQRVINSYSGLYGKKQEREEFMARVMKQLGLMKKPLDETRRAS